MSFKNLFNMLFVFSFIGLIGCTHGYCPDPQTKGKSKKSNVWVYKYDQSKQCDTKPGVSIEEMMKDFNDLKVTVLESKKQFDGLMRIQACGAFTGMANLFLIPKADFDKATSRGFQHWDFQYKKSPNEKRPERALAARGGRFEWTRQRQFGELNQTAYDLLETPP